ncbi:MAG TPA: TolC family protein [Thermoanaerobaculia bacterium]|nr:TolC family protein [Thermoanaerobaculia bacterium]
MLSRFVALAAFNLLTLAGGAAFAATIDWHDANVVARTAADRHPATRRIEAEARSARERITTAGAYPNPMVMAGIQDLQVDLTHDRMMSMYMIGASQTIPRRARRQALRSAAELDVRRIELEGASVRAEAERDALFAWYDIAAADSQIRSLSEVGKALDAIVEAVRARYEAGSAIQADIVRAQLQRSQIDHQILTTTGTRRSAVARLLPLLELPLTTDVPTLILAHSTEERTVSGLREIADTHPALAALLADVERRGQEIRLAELLKRPDINLEASYGMRRYEKDMFSLTARIELPVRRRTTIDPRLREAIAERDVATARIEELRRTLLADLGAAWEAHAEATRQLEFHAERLVPQSKLALDSTRAAYEGGQTTLDSVLSSAAAYRLLEIDNYDYLARHIKAIADFQAIQRGARRGAIGGVTMSSRSGNDPMSSSATSSTEMK